MTFSFVHTSYIHTSMFSFSKPRTHGHCNDLFFLFQSSKATATQAFFFSIPPDPAEQHVLPAFVFKLLPNPCNPLFAHENVPRMGVSPHAGFSTEQNPLRRSFVQPATWKQQLYNFAWQFLWWRSLDIATSELIVTPLSGSFRLEL